MEKESLNQKVKDVSSKLALLVTEELQRVEERGRELQQLQGLLEGSTTHEAYFTNSQYTVQVS